MIDELTDIIKEYEYGKHDILKENPSLRINTSREIVTISPYSLINPDTRTGNCSDISYSLYLRLRNTYKKMFFLIVSGNDPKYFTSTMSENIHFFLMGSENKNILRAKPKNFYDDDFLRTTKPIVLDASLHTVMPFRDSGYLIGNIEKPVKNSVNTAVFYDGISTPLSIENNHIIALNIDFNNPEILSIIIPKRFNVSLSEFISANPELKITPLISYLNSQNPYRKNQIIK